MNDIVLANVYYHDPRHNEHDLPDNGGARFSVRHMFYQDLEVAKELTVSLVLSLGHYVPPEALVGNLSTVECDVVRVAPCVAHQIQAVYNVNWTY